MTIPNSLVLGLGTLGHVRRIPIGPLLPERLRSESVVSIAGRITYDQAKRRESVNFDTRVSLQVRTAAGLPASHSYNAFFKAGQAPVKVGVGIAQQIPTGDADRFLIVLGTDKTSRNQIQIDFLTAGGETLSAGEFWIDVFAPRSASEPWTVSSQR